MASPIPTEKVHDLLSPWSHVHWLLPTNGVIAWDARRKPIRPERQVEDCLCMHQNYPQQIDVLCQKGDYPNAWVHDIKKRTTKDCYQTMHVSHCWNRKLLLRTNTNTPKTYMSNWSARLARTTAWPTLNAVTYCWRTCSQTPGRIACNSTSWTPPIV